MTLSVSEKAEMKKPSLLDRLQARKLNKQAHVKDKPVYDGDRDFKETLIVDEILEADENG